MSLKGYQKEVDNWVKKYRKTGYFPPLAIIARLAEETGELAREINHKFGPKKKKSSESRQEIGDEIASPQVAQQILSIVLCLQILFLAFAMLDAELAHIQEPPFNPDLRSASYYA